jgi:DNA-binding transcriptional ArsR family regulator
MSRIYYDKEKGHYYGEKIIEEDVLIFTDDQEITQIAEKVTKSLNLCLIKAEDTIDLYTIGAFCMIIDPDKVDEDYFENFKEIHDLENPKEFVVILTKPVKLDRSIKKYFIVAQSNGKFESQLTTTLLNRRSNIISRKTDKKIYTKKLNRLFAILRHLQTEGNYVKVSELASEFGVSEKTIKRDLTYLREVGGEEIKYDIKKKAYYLDNSFNSNISTRFD